MILDAMALALAICVTIGRGFFALSRDGLLPKVFSRTSRFDTPWVANLMVAVGGIGLMLVSWLADYQGRFVVPGENGDLVPIFPSDAFATFILSATIGSFAVEARVPDPRGRRRSGSSARRGTSSGSTPSSRSRWRRRCSATSAP